MQLLTAIEYLKVDIANNFSGDLDKKDWDDRIAWFDNQTDLEELVKTAEDPALFYAGVKAYRAALAGEPSGYPISLDACSSGMQLLAVLIGCEKSAKLCGVSSTGHREDAYTNIYKAMCEAIDEEAKITRGDCKDGIMTSLYGSTAMPKKIFGTGALHEAFQNTMVEEAPGVWELKNAIGELWQSEAYSHDWTLPDNYHVHVKVMDTHKDTVHFLNRPETVSIKINTPTVEGRSLQANITHSVDGMVVREMSRRCMFDKDTIIRVINALDSPLAMTDNPHSKMATKLWNWYLETNFLSVRILDYLNVDNMGLVDSVVIAKMIKTMPDVPFNILSVHDCFRALPNYGNDLRKQYNQILSDIAGSTMLSSMASQIVGHNVTVNKIGDLTQQALEADYALS